jgi:D-serine deaminase-like pyridoxal phosphate-dependent protein
MTRRLLVQDLPTPALLLDLDVLERNVQRMADKVAALGARLRPHVKTHKCIEIGRLQLQRGARGITVASIAEAQAFAEHGFDDITWAVPVPLSRLDEVVELARRITFRVLVDSHEALEALAAAARAARLAAHTWLKVDCGYHRAGVDPEAAASVELAQRLIMTPGVTFDGILTHAGHAYHATDGADRRRIAEEERVVMVAFAERLWALGIPVPDVSVGSTPSITAAVSLEGVTEARPGNYVFYDYMQAAAGVCAIEDVAVSVLASVISHQPLAAHAVVDAGALAMSKDLGPGDPAKRRGVGPLLVGLAGATLEPSVNLTAVSQEHGFIAGASAADVDGRFRVGGKVRILPNHSCLTAALFDEYHVVRGEEVVDHWKIWRGR